MSERQPNSQNPTSIPTPPWETGSVAEQIPHTGNSNLPEALREQPVREFDNTTLSEALENNYIEVPTSPAAIIETQPTTEKKRPVKAIVLSGLTAIALTTGGFVTVSALNNSEAPTTDPKGVVDVDTKTDTGEKPDVTEKELSAEEQTEAMKIEAGLPVEEYAERLVAGNLAGWNLAGKDQYLEEWKAAESPVRNDTKIQHAIAEEQKLIHANANFVPGWENTKLAILAEQWREANEILLVTWLKSVDFDGSWGTPEWEEGMVIESVELISEDTAAGTRKMVVSGYQTNNGTETMNPDSPNTKNNGASFKYYITTTTIDGYEYVSDWSVTG